MYNKLNGMASYVMQPFIVQISTGELKKLKMLVLHVWQNEFTMVKVFPMYRINLSNPPYTEEAS